MAASPTLETLLRSCVDFESRDQQRVAVVTYQDAAAEIDWRQLPTHWTARVVDRDSVVLAAAGAARESDEVVVLGPWETDTSDPPDLDDGPLAWSISERAVFEAVRELKSGGRVLALFPASALSAEASRGARRAIMSDAYPDLVIEFSEELAGAIDLGSPTAARGAALIEYQRRGPGGPVRFAVLPSPFQAVPSDFLRDLGELRKLEGGKSRFGFVRRETIQPGAPLNAGYNSPEVGKYRQELSQYGQVVPLSNLFEIRDGPEEDLRTGDWQVECSDNTGGFTVSEITRGDGHLSEGAVIVRQREVILADDREFLRACLGSTATRNLYEVQEGAGALNAEGLGRVPVVLPSAQVRAAFADLVHARNRLVRWKADVDTALARLTELDAGSRRISEIMDVGRLPRQRVVAAERLDELSYRVRTQFPWPLAVLWRSVAASGNGLEGYTRALEFAEALAYYLVILGIVASRELGIILTKLEAIAERVTTTGRGITFGDLSDLLLEMRGRSYRHAMGPSNPFPEISEFMTNDDEADRAFRRLRERRNDFAHNRGPRGEAEVRDALSATQGDIDTLLTRCEFLALYPLRRIVTTRWDSIRGRNELAYRELMGDNEQTPIASDETTSATMESGSLYVVDRTDSWHLLRPLLIWCDCTICRRSAAMVFDSYDSKSDSCSLRSLDHGHAMTDAGLREAFQGAGLIVDVGGEGTAHGVS
jgi:hypothetical protein